METSGSPTNLSPSHTTSASDWRDTGYVSLYEGKSNSSYQLQRQRTESPVERPVPPSSAPGAGQCPDLQAAEPARSSQSLFKAKLLHQTQGFYTGFWICKGKGPLGGVCRFRQVPQAVVTTVLVHGFLFVHPLNVRSTSTLNEMNRQPARKCLRPMSHQQHGPTCYLPD